MSFAASLPVVPTIRRVDTRCRHCGDVCVDRTASGHDGTFCCGGCEAVFTLLHREGLDAFYSCELPPGVSQRTRRPEDDLSLHVLDEAGVAARFIERTGDGLTQATFVVPGMHCASCLWLLERLWKVDPGIVRSDVDLGHRTVRVTYRADRLSLRQVAEHLRSIGYPPALEADTSRPTAPYERRRLYAKIGVAGFAFGNAMLFSIPRYLNGVPLGEPYQTLFGALNLALALGVLVFSASDFFVAASRAFRYRTITLDVPVALGLTALFLRTAVDITLGRGEGFTDSFTGLVFFLLIGRLFQQKAFERIAFDRTFRSFLPLAARVENRSTARHLPIDQLRPGDRVVLRAGEILPADAELDDDMATLDLSFITGEDRPVLVHRHDRVAAGSRVVERARRFTLTSDVVGSRLAVLWARARSTDAPDDALADLAGRFGLWFSVVALAVATAGVVAWWPDRSAAASVATAVLIIACPCALTLAAPLTLGTAMTALGERGVFLKRPGVALALGRIDVIAFDKTGTLTSTVEASRAASALDPLAWRLVSALAAQSVHPISRGIVAAHEFDGGDEPLVASCQETAGRGIDGLVDGHRVVLGAADFVAERAQGVPAGDASGPSVAIDGTFAGRLPIASVMRPGLLDALKELGTSHRTLVLSGDQPTDHLGDTFGDGVWFRQSPEDKITRVERLQRDGHRVLMVGDGINDAAALGAATVGMAVSDDTACVVPACDVVIGGPRLRDLPGILRFARRARLVIAACFVVSVVYNIGGLTLALTGALTPLVAAVLMPVSSLTIVALSVGATRWFARGLPA